MNVINRHRVLCRALIARWNFTKIFSRGHTVGIEGITGGTINFSQMHGNFGKFVHAASYDLAMMDFEN